MSMEAKILASASRERLGSIPSSEVYLIQEEGCTFELRRASFGRVYLGAWRDQEVAVKIVPASLVKTADFVAHIQHVVGMAAHHNVQRIPWYMVLPNGEPDLKKKRTK
jgi:hypothetical protein